MNRQVIGCVAAVFSVLSAFAVEKHWAGTGDWCEWAVAENWSPSGIPGETDTVIFEPEGKLTVNVNGNYNRQLRHLRVNSGSLYIVQTNKDATCDLRFRYGTGVTNEIYIADGAELVMSNKFITSSGGNGVVRRTGNGVFDIHCQPGDGGWGNFKSFIFDSGVSYVKGPGTGTMSMSIFIRDGARVVVQKDYQFHLSSAVLTVDRGGVLDFDYHYEEFAGLAGEGCVTNVGSAKISLGRGPHAFTGSIFKSPKQDTWIVLTLSRADGLDDDHWYWAVGSNSLAAVKLELPSSTGTPLRFVPGAKIYKVNALQLGTKALVTTEDLDGNPIDLYTYLHNSSQNLRLVGSGGFYAGTYGNFSIYKGPNTDLSGFTGSFGAALSRTLTIGDGTVEGWPDIPEVVTYNAIRPLSGSDGAVQFSPPTTGGEVGTLKGDGIYRFYRKTVVRNADTSGCWIQPRENSDTTIAGGNLLLSWYTWYGYDNAVLTLTNGAYMGGLPATSGTWESAIKLPRGTYCQSDANKASIRLVGGGRYNSNGAAVKSTEVGKGGVLELSTNRDGSGSADNPSSTVVDGGLVRVRTEVSPYNIDVIANSDKQVFNVGPGGMSLDFDLQNFPRNSDYNKFYFYRGIGSIGTGAGGITRTGAGWMRLSRPLTIAGAFRSMDGTLLVQKTDYMADGTTPLFGTGDFVLGNSILQFATDLASGYSAKIGTGGAFGYAGAATVRVRYSATDVPKTLSFGTLRRDAAASALFLWDQTSDASFDESASKVFFATAPAALADGRVREPLYVLDRRKNYAAVRFVDFAKYDVEDGVRSFDAYCDGFDDAEGKTVRIPRKQLTLSSNLTVAGLQVNGYAGAYSYQDTGYNLKIAKDVTLKVDGGDAPGQIILNSSSDGWSPSVIRGGTIDFGAKEGLVVVNGTANGEYHDKIHSTITGTGGLSVVAPAVFDIGYELELGVANTYAGGTRINGARVRPMVSGAFSTGDVYLGDGEIAGGGLLMAVEGLDIPNNIHAAGWGAPDRDGGLFSHTDMGYGAIIFSKSGRLSGSLDMYGPMRTWARAGTRGEYAGKVTGDKLWIWGKKGSNAGKIVLSNAQNSYTNGTWVYNSTLVLKDVATAGTGEIMLDNGVLELENAEERTVSNPVRGVGTVRLAGRGSVHFAEVAPQNSAGFTLDLTKKVTTVDTLDGFGKITTGRTQPTHLIVADGKGKSFTGEVPENVTVYDPGEYTPPGLTLILR